MEEEGRASLWTLRVIIALFVYLSFWQRLYVLYVKTIQHTIDIFAGIRKTSDIDWRIARAGTFL